MRPAPGLLLLAAGLLGCTSPAEDAQRAKAQLAQEKLRAELLAMGEEERASIEASLSPSANREEISRAYFRRVQRLKEIVQDNGWPTISRVGKDGASAAWIVVHHADLDVEFQRRCVPLLEAAAQEGEVELKHMACLTDRVLTATGQPQAYGTQGMPVPAANLQAVNARRGAIGLLDLEVYRKHLEDGTAVTTCRR
jgi:hypothetical protein